MKDEAGNDGPPELNRRSLLCGLASASGIATGFAAPASAAEPETTIIELTGEEREQTLQEAVGDDRTESLLTAAFDGDSEMTSAKTVRSSYAETEWRVVTATFESESGTELRLFWSDHWEAEPTATVTESARDRSADELRVETPANGVVPFGINPCDWGDVPDPECIIEIGHLYAEEIATCGRCASNVQRIASIPNSKKELLFKIARLAPSCGSCLVSAIQKYGEYGIPCELCVPEEEIGLEEEDAVRV